MSKRIIYNGHLSSRLTESEIPTDMPTLDTSSYHIDIDDSKKSAEGIAKEDETALIEILTFIAGLSQAEKDNLWVTWCRDEEQPGDGINGDNDIVVNVYARDAMPDGKRTIATWTYAEQQIRKALNIESSGAVTEAKTLKESEDAEDDFYEDVIELFDPSGIGQKKVLTDAYIKDILNDPTVEDSDKEKFKQILASEELLDEALEVVAEALYDSGELSDYISDYSAYELSEMDGPWNTVMDIVNECLWDFVKRDLQEGCRTEGLKESYRRTVARGSTLVDNELFVDFE
jgi:hypothetical protein